MKSIIRKLTLPAAALATMAALATSAVAAEKVVLGVAIPAATHGFTGGIVFWANQAKKELEKAHPDLKVIVKTAANAAEQANQLQDLMAVSKINTLVVFPFESAALTKPVAEVHNKGVYVTVVDRGLTDTSAQDAYVSGDNTAFGKIPAEYLAKAMGGKGNLVALRGIATTLDNERWDAFTGVMKNYLEIQSSGEIARMMSFIAGLLGCSTQDVWDELEKLLDVILPKKPLHEYGVTQEDLPQFADAVMKTQTRLMSNNFVPLDEARVLKIYKELY